ncbi:MAG: DNA repair protein RecN [Chthoniobacterales bacterium]
MLASLRIRNFALVESLAWEIPAGFVAITGETGAGKSILIGGLGLLLGERADKSSIRSGESECVVEAAASLRDDSPIHALLAEAGIEPCEDGQLLLKRVVSASGSGRQFVNGSPCTLALLREIGDRLIDLHGPHDHQSLFSRDAQTRLLDAFGAATAALADYRTARAEWLTLEHEQAEASAHSQAREREIALLEHQSGEIEAAALKPDEEEALVANQQTAANATRLKELAAAAAQALSEAEDSAESRIAEVGRLIRELAKLDPSQAGIAARHAALVEETGDISRALIGYGDRIDADPRSLAEIESRLDLLQNLKRKYGATLAEVIAFGEDAAQRLGSLRGQVERSANLDAEISAAKKHTLAAGAKLSKLRAAAAPKLASSVRKHLADLGFLKVGFEIRLEAGEPGPEGLETVEFVFAPNPGEPAQPLRSIASSGEISRVMLALKTSLAAQDEVPVLVFDEIDANVGGEIAHAVGAKMREIGVLRQVLCITHLPQVASAAGAHFVVSKSVVGGRTISLLDEVAAKKREEEIARMLGSRSGEAALAHARELLGA